MGSCNNDKALHADPITSFLMEFMDELETFADTIRSELQLQVDNSKAHWKKYVDLSKQPKRPNETQDEHKARINVAAESTLLLLKANNDKIKAIRERLVAKLNETDVDLLSEQLVRMLPLAKGMPKDFVEGFGVERARGLVNRLVEQWRGGIRSADKAEKHFGGMIGALEKRLRA
jgi:hypothetical protein